MRRAHPNGIGVQPVVVSGHPLPPHPPNIVDLDTHSDLAQLLGLHARLRLVKHVVVGHACQELAQAVELRLKSVEDGLEAARTDQVRRQVGRVVEQFLEEAYELGVLVSPVTWAPT